MVKQPFVTKICPETESKSLNYSLNDRLLPSMTERRARDRKKISSLNRLLTLFQDLIRSGKLEVSIELKIEVRFRTSPRPVDNNKLPEISSVQNGRQQQNEGSGFREQSSEVSEFGFQTTGIKREKRGKTLSPTAAKGSSTSDHLWAMQKMCNVSDAVQPPRQMPVLAKHQCQCNNSAYSN